jgi:hypothetical protein
MRYIRNNDPQSTYTTHILEPDMNMATWPTSYPYSDQ